MTEIPTSHVTRGDMFKLGSVGTPLPGVECKVSHLIVYLSEHLVSSLVDSDV